MNDNAEGGVWRPGRAGRDPGRTEARELVYDARRSTPRVPGGGFHTRGDGDFAFGPRDPEDSDALDYLAFFRSLWRRKLLAMTIAVLATSVAAVIIMRLPAHYVAHALVLIGNPLQDASRGAAPAALPDTGTVQTSVEVLRSPQLAAEVIRRLNLEENPEFNPTAAERDETGMIARLTDVISRAREWCCGRQAPADPHADPAAAELSRTVDGFLGQLRVSIKDNSRMIDVAFESMDARLAMLVANALVDSYVNEELELRAQSARQRADWLRARIGELQAEVENAEEAAAKFRSENGLFSMPGGSPLLLKQMADVSAELADAETTRAAIEARLRQLRASLGAAGGDGATGGVVDSPLMRTLQEEEAKALQQLAEASVKFGDKYPTNVGLRERLRYIRSSMQRENQRVIASLDDDLRIARMREQDLSQRLSQLKSDVSRMNRADITVRALERKAQADQVLLDDFIARLQATSQETDTSLLRPTAQIASYAQLPVSPERPKKALLILVAGVASLIGAVLVVHLIEKSDRSLHSLDEVEGHLKVAGLGMLPISEAARLSAVEAARYGSVYREALKATYLSLFGTREMSEVAVVTSAMPGEGKTTLALSLAAMAAQGRQRVIILDADFWKKDASAALGFRTGVGLAEVLEGKATLADAIISDVVSGADVMLPGRFSRGSLLTWIDDFRELLDSLRDQYDVVIIDAPPVLSASEAALLAKHADATVMAVRWGSTSRDAAAVAARKLHDAGAFLAGSVITMVREREHAKYGYVDAAYFSSKFEIYQSPPTTAISWSSLTEDSAGERTPGKALSRKPAVPRHALLVVDMQEHRGVPSGSYSPSKAARDRLIETINGVSELAARSGVMVVYAHQNLSHFTKVLSHVRTRRTGGYHAVELDAGLRTVSEFNFPKPAPDAFSNSRLDPFLREKGIDHLFIVGVDGVTSINQTAHSALALGYRVTFIQDGIFTTSEDRWKRLLKVFESAAAFAISREEFAEFCQRLRLRNRASA